MDERIINVLGERYRVKYRDNMSTCCKYCSFFNRTCTIGNEFLCDLVSLLEPVYFEQLEEDERPDSL